MRPSLRALTVLLATGLSAAAQSVTFTGDVAADFPATSVFIADPGGVDVGVPAAFPTGTLSGWDMEQTALAYDQTSDTLYVGFDTYGITGDADGDGDPGVTSATLAGLGGTDFLDLGGTEAVGCFLDLDDDGNFDISIGVSAVTDINGVQTAFFSGSVVAAGFAFGSPTGNPTSVFASPDASAPDLEIAVSGFSSILVSYLQPGQVDFGAVFFMGSFGDAGIGEDYVPDPTPARIPVGLFCQGGPQATVVDLGPSCPGLPTLPVLSADPPALNTTPTVTVTAPFPNAPFWIWVSVGPVSPWVVPGTNCSIWVDVLNPANARLLWSGTLDATGSFSAPYALPMNVGRIGLDIILQARVWAPGGPLNGDWMSNGLGMTIGCL